MTALDQAREVAATTGEPDDDEPMTDEACDAYAEQWQEQHYRAR